MVVSSIAFLVTVAVFLIAFPVTVVVFLIAAIFHYLQAVRYCTKQLVLKTKINFAIFAYLVLSKQFNNIAKGILQTEAWSAACPRGGALSG